MKYTQPKKSYFNVINFIVAVILLCPIISYAKFNKITLDQITVKDGLSQVSINSISQDDDGFLWISTESGLEIYDGYTFTKIEGPDNDFSQYSAGKTVQSANGLMWLQLYGKGLYSFDKSTNEFDLLLNTNQLEPDDWVIDYLPQKDETVWVATSKYIATIDVKTKAYKQIVNLKKYLGDSAIQQIILHNNYLYIASKEGTIVYQLSTGQVAKLPQITKVTAQSADLKPIQANKIYTLSILNQTLFLGTNDGVYSLNIQQIDSLFAMGEENELPHYQTIFKHLSVWDFFIEKELLIIGATDGLYRYNAVTQQGQFLFSFDEYAPSFANNTVKSLIVDQDGYYWLVSNSQGLLKWNPNLGLVENYDYYKGRDNSLTSNNVTGILPDKNDDNLFWISTDNGLNLLNRNTQHVEQFFALKNSKTTFTASNIVSLHYGSNKTIWLNTSVGLRLFEIKSKAIIPIPFEASFLEKLTVDYPVYFTTDKYLWFTQTDQLLMIDQESGQSTDFSKVMTDAGIKDIWFFFKSPNQDKEIWFSTTKALWMFNTQYQTFKKIYEHINMSETEWSFIDSFVVDAEKSLLWVAHTSKGIYGISLETQEVLHTFNNQNSILDNNLYGLQQDSQGDLWISTHDGIYSIDTRSFHIRKFGIHHGFLGMEFNGGAHAKSSTDELVYGSVNGVSFFDPLALKEKGLTKNKNVFVTKVDLLTRHLEDAYIFNSNKVVELKYDDVGIRVDFTTFDFSKSKDIMFEYSLTSNSTVNYPSTYENHIIFPSLESGKHTLAIRAKSPITGDYSPLTYIKFNVSYAPWASPTAYILYFILVISAFSFWINKRRKQRDALLAAHEQVVFRENRLQLALKGSNSDVWDWHAQTNSFSANRFKHNVSLIENAYTFPIKVFINDIHPDDKATFLAAWQQFIDKADVNVTFTFTYRLKGEHNEWRWYKDLGKIVEIDDNKKPIRVTGSYTNITQSKADEERAQYYGEAFRHTKDWVLIINQDFTKVTSNQAMRNIFGWEEEQPFNDSLIGIDRKKIKYYSDVALSLGVNDHWRGEELVTSAAGDKYNVLVKINVGINSNDSLHYIMVMTDITAQKLAESELRYMANYDHLTGLPNRSLLIERIDHAIELSARNKNILAIFFIDLDRFKQVNDTLGHDVGDRLLKVITQRLTKVFRQEDTLARLGGDEFVVLLESFSSVDKLSQIAQKIIDTIEQPITLQDTMVCIGSSIGISIYPEDGMDSAELLRNSDIAMYCAKQNGRNIYQYFEPSMTEAAAKRLALEANLKQAVKQKQFINHYQPIVDAHYGKAVGVEMLMRWPTDKGMISPMEFIPLAEDLNLIISMTEVALKTALQDLIVWRSFRTDFYLSINISASHFSKGELVTFITRILNEFDLPTSAIKLEVTESAFISEPEKAIEKMNQLKAIGIKLSLDDFGTGYSSLSYLRLLPLDVIKIDRSFISNIGENNADEAIIEATISLAQKLGMSCVAEGAETKEQIDFLVSRNCHYIQGYFYSKPVSSEQIISLLEMNKPEYISPR
ncbi:EAL domain-containing protein [Colwellia sp. BRX8-9]|uniref:EAL domain-containing protein n=1 Tax=Colwellia sp. BRX8-9 TaxID=2759831 RepID=UPI0015F6FFA8|nr:EAL domain-containing protein [Colwellia sp. BRX8-9]MBA6348392.1 EAL domain-containing protein [Colwellia sp. BRX8-9]